MYTILFYLFACVAPICTVHMSVSTDNEPIEDKCDYLDYSEIDLLYWHWPWSMGIDCDAAKY